MKDNQSDAKHVKLVPIQSSLASGWSEVDDEDENDEMIKITSCVWCPPSLCIFM